MWLYFFKILRDNMTAFRKGRNVKVIQLLKKFPEFYETRSFIKVFVTALHLSLSWTRALHSISSDIFSLKSTIILSNHQHLDLPSSLFPSRFPLVLYIHSTSVHSCHFLCPFHTLWFYHSNFTRWRVQVTKLLIMELFETTCHFILLWSKYFSSPCSQTA
jgi:hypothetical protein